MSLSDPRRRLLEMAAFVIAVAVNAACGTSVSPIEVAPGCPGRPLREPGRWAAEPGDRLVDDFEDGNIQLVPVAGRDGAWIRGYDATAAVTAEISSRCAARGLRAGHFAASGLTDWGANWTAVLRQTVNDAAVAYDASRYNAISFWAAVGDSAVPPFEAPVGLTTMDVAWNGHICTDGCMDYYRTVVPLTHDWRRVVVRFDTLAQSGWGEQYRMRRDQLVGFIIWPEGPFDIWIDDVRFEP